MQILEGVMQFFGGDHTVLGGGHAVFGGVVQILCAAGERKKSDFKGILRGSWRILPPKAAENFHFLNDFQRGKHYFFVARRRRAKKSIFEGILGVSGV